MYQFDITAGADPDSIRDVINDIEILGDDQILNTEFNSSERAKAFRLASNAYEHRSDADAVLGELSRDWSVARMPVVDRSILRLAHYEMTRVEGSEPKGVVNEAVELAKQFSTEQSPGFVNAILDKILKRVLASAPAPEGA